MNAVPFEKIIPSKDVRDYCEKIGHHFTLSEQATLVFNNPLLNFDEIDSLLEKILISCGESDEDKKLKKELEEQLEFDKKIKKIFYNEEKAVIDPSGFDAAQPPLFFYSISWDYGDEWDDDHYCFFSTFDGCKKHIEKEFANDEKHGWEKRPFRITKKYLDPIKSSKYISVTFSPDFELEDIYSLGFGDEVFTECVPRENNRFEDNYVEVPHPFRKGDIVKSLAKGRFCKEASEGLVCRPEDEEDYNAGIEHHKKLKARNLIDFSDICLNVEYLCGKKGDWDFSHDHPYIPTLVYAELPASTEQEKARKELFEVAQELLRGEGSLEIYGYTMRSYNEKY